MKKKRMKGEGGCNDDYEKKKKVLLFSLSSLYDYPISSPDFSVCVCFLCRQVKQYVTMKTKPMFNMEDSSFSRERCQHCSSSFDLSVKDS